MAARTWLIAGVSSGFGRELSTQLVDHGDHVVGTIREPSKVTDLIPIVRCEILAEGILDDRWSAWFYGHYVSGDADVGTTRIAGPLPRSGGTAWTARQDPRPRPPAAGGASHRM
jgi:NAD(P)-dependent dehydrogenase (short-subunit alcohol dehydrogenase family)